MGQPATILITRPYKRDDASEYTYQWGQDAVNIAKMMGYNVIDVKGDKTTYNNVSALLEKYKPRLYAHFGHGCPSSIQGRNECIITRNYDIGQLMDMVEQDPSKSDMVCNILDPISNISACTLQDKNAPDYEMCYPICTKDTNVQLLNGTITLSVACHTASRLGECAVSSGTETYIGFDDLLMFPIDSLGSQNIFKDVYVHFFKELLYGKTVEEANKSTIAMENKLISQYKPVKYIALPMLWNKMHRVILGNKDNSIYI